MTKNWSAWDGYLRGVAAAAILDSAVRQLGWWGALIAAAWAFASGYVWQAHTSSITKRSRL